MRPLNQLETFLQRVFERPGRVLLSRKLHPLELANAVERCLEDNLQPLIGEPVTPNVISLRVHPADYETFEPVKHALEADLVDRIAEVVSSRKYRIVGPIQVWLQSDEGVERGEVLVEGRFLESRSPDLTVVAQLAPLPPTPVQKTTVLSFDGALPVTRLRLRHENVDGTNTTWPLRQFPSTIGRSSDNDVQLPDLRVSRRHARITQSGESLELTDLGSSNGTLVNGQTVTNTTLKVGDQISLGGVILIVETDA